MRHTETSGRPRNLMAAWALLILAGCVDADSGPSVSTYPIKGKVVMPDGKPLGDGSVVFVPSGKEGVQASGKIAADGTFALTTRREGDGAAVGTYKVRIDGSTTLSAPKGTKVKGAGLRIFGDEDTSGLSATVTSGTNDLPPFILKAPDTSTSSKTKSKAEAKKGRAD